VNIPEMPILPSCHYIDKFYRQYGIFCPGINFENNCSNYVKLKIRRKKAMLPSLKTRAIWPNLVEEFFNGEFPKFFEAETRHSIPAVNISENRDEYRIEVAAPGLSKEDFRINLENNVLTVSSEKEEKRNQEDEQVMRREFSYSVFSRSFTLPQTVNPEKIRAVHKEGVLTINVPKRDEAKTPSREIKIS
jgi:HSP20 family protein